MSSIPIIYGIDNINTFHEIIQQNKGIVVIKFGATWCGPCKKIEPFLRSYMSTFSTTIQFVIVDVDKNGDIYSYLRNKKMVNGIPVLLAYYKENNSYIPNDIVVGADAKELELFFRRCNDKLVSYQSSRT